MAEKKSEIVTVVEGKPKTLQTYNEDVADEILQRLMNGETLTSICRDIGITPAQVYGWIQRHDEFSVRFARARDFGDTVLEDLAIDASDERNADVEVDEVESERGVGRSRKMFDNVGRSRLRAETRLKVVARRKGAKITNTIRFAKKTEAEQASEMSSEELLKIARMTVEGLSDEGES